MKCTTVIAGDTIKSCGNSRTFGPNKLSIFHLKHLETRAISYITALFNDSVFLILPNVNAHLPPDTDQHGFRPGHSTTSALLQIQPEKATKSNGLQRGIHYCGVRYRSSHSAVQDRKILASSDNSAMAVVLPSRETFQWCHVVGKTSPCRCPAGLQFVTVTT